MENNMNIAVNGKIIGKTEDKTFRKSVKASKHLYRQFNGYSIALSVLEELKGKGIENIEIFDKESKTLYRTTVETYFSKGHEIWIKGFEPQLCLSLVHFNQEEIK
jgi:hypothetical protein